MLYVCIVDDRGIGVIDTTDAVLEFVTRETLFSLRDKGIKIAGMTDDSINICSGDWLEDEFFQCCVQEVNAKFRKTRFQNDKQIFTYLINKFDICVKEIHLSLKQLLMPCCSDTGLISDCICELVRKNGIECTSSYCGRLCFSTNDCVKLVSVKGIDAYVGVSNNKKKFFKIVWSD